MRPSQIDMMEATRLTREGRLQEAMALLQGTAPRADASPLQAPRADGGRLIDMVRPTAPSGAWSAPDLGAARTSAPAAGPAAWSVPAGLSGLPGLGRAPAARAALPAGARFEERVHAGPAGSRPYRLYVPAAAAPDGGARPLVVMLHGCTQSAEDFAAGTRMNALAEEHGFLVAYPEQTQGANAQRCWNWFNPADQRREGGEAALIAGIARAVIAEEGADASRVYAAGLSAGGAAAANLAGTHPDLFAAVGVHSGLACGAARDVMSALTAMRQGGGAVAAPARPVPTIVFHGDRDGTVHPVNGDEVARGSGAGEGLRAEVETGRTEGRDWTRTLHRDPAGVTRLEQWVLHGAGHAWSGGSRDGSHTDPRGPDASREMIRFFAQHRRPGA